MSSSEAVKRASATYRCRHQERVGAYNKAYLERNREMMNVRRRMSRMQNGGVRIILNSRTRNYRAEQRYRVLDYYSNGKLCCALCDEARLPCLSIDHIEGNGNAHRRSIGVKSGSSFYSWIEKNGFPTGFRVLCANCQSMSRYALRGYTTAGLTRVDWKL